MLLHYLGKLKVQICYKSGEKCKQNALIFLHASTLCNSLSYLLLAYLLLQYLVRIKYSLKLCTVLCKQA